MRDQTKHGIFVTSILLFVALFSLGVRFAGQPALMAGEEKCASATVELPIVMYHHVLKESSRWNKYTISPDELRQDFEYLQSEGFTPITVKDLILWTQGEGSLPQKPVMITFDDGHESFYEYAYPMLAEYGFCAVYSVVGKYVDEYTSLEDHHVCYSYSNWEILLEMQESGLVEIQNHTYDLHQNQNGRKGAGKKAGEELEQYRRVLTEDIGKLQDECEEYLGRRPTAFTYPFGEISQEALPILKEMGFQAALACREKYNDLTGDPEELFHLNRFNRPHGTSLQTILERAKEKEGREK